MLIEFCEYIKSEIQAFFDDLALATTVVAPVILAVAITYTLTRLISYIISRTHK